MTADLTQGMREALANMAGRREATSVSWGPASDVHKASLEALVRRGLAVHNRFHCKAKLTAEGIATARTLAAEDRS